MSRERFAALRRQVLTLHAADDYAAALVVATSAAADHPDAAERTTYAPTRRFWDWQGIG